MEAAASGGGAGERSGRPPAALPCPPPRPAAQQGSRGDKAQTDLENTKKMKDAIQAELDASKKMVSRMRETNFDDMAEASIQIHA